MEWSNEKVLEFIQFYETENIIWNPSNPDHKKKHLNESVQEEHAECDDEDEVNTVSRNTEDPIPTSSLNSRTTNKLAKIKFPSEILHAKRQMQETFEHVKSSVSDEYEMFGKLIAS
ncbi:unnamed protein product [Parnassius apollo]|uniref:(apollo) hypothetical protein n=1 Tax=Parnassius apollo TaxID=110799 RepID=A0A8S3XKK0_PARAO|nr:unnamed protein product [Parnassius apollo]